MQPEHSRSPDLREAGDDALRDYVGSLRERYPLDAIRRRAARRRGVRRAIGGTALCAVLGAFAWQADPAWRVEQVSTPVGGHLDRRLADGTRLVLNTDSAVYFESRLHSRRLSVERGEAYVEVAHEALRPLMTRAGTLQIRDIGTAFTVRRDAALTQVGVSSGAVEVALAGQPARRLDAGQALDADGGRLGDPHALPADALAWVQGRLSFDAVPLRTAAAELQRYRAAPIRVAPDAAALKLSGQFNSGNVETLLDLLPRVLPVHVTRAADGAVLIAHR